MPFNWVEGDAGARLRQMRLDSIDRIIEVASDRSAQFILVAGDLFDANTIEDRIVIQACEKFRHANIPVLVIPGNHDHCAGPDCVYRRKTFAESRPDNLYVLERRAPFPLESLNVVVLPAPLRQRHEVGDTTQHITPDFGADFARNGYRIGLAHGGMPWFGEDAAGEATNAIAQDRSTQGQLDYLALGDWHSTKAIDLRTWYSGAPEPTTYRQHDAGNVLCVELQAPGEDPKVEKLSVGKSQWLRHDTDVSSAEDLGALAAWFDAIDRPLDTLVRLSLVGTVSFEQMKELENLLKLWSGKLLHLRQRGAGVITEPTAQEIDSIASDGYVKMALDQLRAGAESEGEDQTTASDALRLLYRLNIQGDAN